MKKILLPLILALVGAGAGFGAGTFTAPTPTEHAAPAAAEAEPAHSDDPLEASYVKLRNQFIVPIVRDDVVRSMVILTLAVESETYTREEIGLIEPRLQATLLAALFDYSSIGGFTGNFTSPEWRSAIQTLLRVTAQETVSPEIDDILLLAINRQDY